MAGWTHIPLVSKSNWQKLALWQEIYKAWNERRIAIGQSPTDVPVYGARIQPASMIQSIQTWIETYCVSFVATINSNGVRINDFEGQYIIAFEMWDWLKIKIRILNGVASWSKKTFYDTRYTTGQLTKRCEASYIVMLNELRLVLNELVWTKQSNAYTNNNEINQFFVPAFINKSWTVEQNEDYVNSIFPSQTAMSNTMPYKYNWVVDSPPHGYTTFAAYAYLYACNIPRGFAKVVDFYIQAYAAGDGYEFDNQGASFLLNDQRSHKYNFSVSLASSDTETPLQKIGDELCLNQWPDLSQGAIGEGDMRGWLIDKINTLIRWNVTGGFTYY